MKELTLIEKVEAIYGGRGHGNINLVPPPLDPPLAIEPNRGGFGLPQLRSPEVNEVLSAPPIWLIRWGITVFFGVMLLIFTVSYFVKYPDLVKGSLVLVAENTPKSVIAKQNTTITKLYVREGQQVEKGQTLAFYESTANMEEIEQLEQSINGLLEKIEKGNALHDTQMPQFFGLGELQKPFQIFQDALTRAKALGSSGSFAQKKNALAAEINSIDLLKNSTVVQLGLQEKDLNLALENAQNQEKLAAKGLVSKMDARNALAAYLSKKQAFEQANTVLASNGISRLQKQQEIIELDKTVFEQQARLTQIVKSLKSDIETWKQQYLARAAMAGKVSFARPIQENQQLAAGQELCYILNADESFKGEMKMGQFNLGKIKTDQRVIVKFKSHPFEEFGAVDGRIERIAELPQDSTYLVNVSFPKGLETTTNHHIGFKNGMEATAEVITADKRLIDRFLIDITRHFRR